VIFDELAHFRPYIDLLDLDDPGQRFGTKCRNIACGRLGIDEENPSALYVAKPSTTAAERLITYRNVVGFKQTQEFVEDSLVIHFVRIAYRATAVLLHTALKQTPATPCCPRPTIEPGKAQEKA